MEALWLEFRSPLSRLFTHLGARADQVDDLLQDTFLRIHTGIASLRDHNRHAAWIRSIARNVWIDSQRVGARETPTRPDPSLVEDIEEQEDQDAFGREVGGWLLEELEGLDETDREILRRFELGGESQKDIAADLGLSLNAVKARVLRGRQKIRQRIENCCAFEFDRRGRPVGARKRGGADCGGGECAP
jgi:RNA polymerase sigma-70 factor (ECF subfamily)